MTNFNRQRAWQSFPYGWEVTWKKCLQSPGVWFSIEEAATEAAALRKVKYLHWFRRSLERDGYGGLGNGWRLRFRRQPPQGNRDFWKIEVSWRQSSNKAAISALASKVLP